MTWLTKVQQAFMLFQGGRHRWACPCREVRGQPENKLAGRFSLYVLCLTWVPEVQQPGVLAQGWRRSGFPGTPALPRRVHPRLACHPGAEQPHLRAAGLAGLAGGRETHAWTAEVAVLASASPAPETTPDPGAVHRACGAGALRRQQRGVLTFVWRPRGRQLRVAAGHLLVVVSWNP